jgi:hypothetical protein
MDVDEAAEVGHDVLHSVCVDHTVELLMLRWMGSNGYIIGRWDPIKESEERESNSEQVRQCICGSTAYSIYNTVRTVTTLETYNLLTCTR